MFTLKLQIFKVKTVYLTMAYQVNPDRNQPWNALPELPVDPYFYKDVEVFVQLGNAKATPHKAIT